MAVATKICGLSTPETVAAAVDGGASHIGFVFFARSPRSVTVARAAELAEPVRGRAKIVALTVDADDALLEAIVSGLRPDMLQMHGHESPQRCAEVRARWGVPVMKAISVATAADLEVVPAYAPHVDMFLFDTKAPKSLAGALPGGNGIAFDWTLLNHLDPGKPFMLSGGLDAENVARAIAITGTAMVDVSSGVESAPGCKDPERIQAFLVAVKSAGPNS